MNKRFQFLLSFWLVVITDPYSNINYDEPQVYHIDKQLQSITIKVYCAEGHDDCHNDTSNTAQERTYEEEHKPQKETTSIFCYLCTPPQWFDY